MYFDILKRKGLAKLMKRVKEGDLLVLMTDKSGKMMVVSVEDYFRMGLEHIKDDTEVGQDKAKEIQRKLNGHMSMWLKMSCQGEKWNHQDRMRETCLNQSCAVSPLYLLIKDHKKTNPGELPKTRPVCDGTSGMDVHLSNHLSGYLEAMADMMEDKVEVNSSEDLMSRVDDYNEMVETVMAGSGLEEDDARYVKYKMYTRLRQMEVGVTITGADAKALYPSLKGRHTARVVRDAALKTKLRVEGMNWQEVARYVAMGYDPFEKRALGLERILPKRRFHKGAKPGVTGKEPLSKAKGDEVRWVFPVREATEDEKRKLLAAALEIGVRAAFSTHLYQFGGQIYHQKDGGPIGTRLAGAAARVVMAEWGDRVREILKKEGVPVFLAACYVDDVRMITGIIPEGWRWNSKQKSLEFMQDWQEEDQSKGVTDSRRTATVLVDIMNSVFCNIQFEAEIQDDFEDNRLPTLDFRLWMDQGQDQGGKNKDKVMYSFFEKEMASPYCIMEKSAMPESTKVSSLAQDLVRRMTNTTEMVTQQERDSIVEDYILKLARSGYNKKQRREIIESGLKGYETKLEKAAKSGNPLHRSAQSTMASRHKKKILSKTTWFKNKKEEDNEREAGNRRPGSKSKKRLEKPEGQGEVATVLFVERTWHGELARRLRQAETDLYNLTGDKIKIVERTGTTLKDLLHNTNPWAGQNCGRKGCMICLRGGEGSGDCRKRNVTYSTFCLPCQKEGISSKYYGETARTGHERGLEHLRDYWKDQEDSHMSKHWLTVHGHDQQKPEFGMKVIRSHKSAFSRQVHEAVLIEMAEGGLLNSKGEFNRCEIPRLTVHMGQKEWEDKIEETEEITELEEESQIEARHGNKRISEVGEGQPIAKRRRRTACQTAYQQHIPAAGSGLHPQHCTTGLEPGAECDKFKPKDEKKASLSKRQREPDVAEQETPSKKQKPARVHCRPAGEGVGARRVPPGKDNVKTVSKSSVDPFKENPQSKFQTIVQMFNKIGENPEKFKPKLNPNFNVHPSPGSNLTDQNSAPKTALEPHPVVTSFSTNYKANHQLSLTHNTPPQLRKTKSKITVKRSPATINHKNLITKFFPPKPAEQQKTPTNLDPYKPNQQ